MVFTPNTSNTLPNEFNNQDFSQCIDPASIENLQEQSGILDSTYLFYDYFTENDLFSEAPIYNYPVMTSSTTAPSFVVDNVLTPQDLNDPTTYNPSFITSPSLEPPNDFFPEYTPVTTTSGPLMQQISIAPSVAIPVVPPLTTTHGNSPPSVNIPWTTGATISSTIDDLTQDVVSTSFMSIADTPESSFMSISSVDPPKEFMSTSSVETPKSPAVVSSSSTAATTSTKLGTRRRKRSIGEIGKDPHTIEDELALKRAKNTEAARRSRLKKMLKMESLQNQVNELKKENTGLLTRIAILESEKKGLEDKNSEKEERMDQQLSETRKRLVSTNK